MAARQSPSFSPFASRGPTGAAAARSVWPPAGSVNRAKVGESTPANSEPFQRTVASDSDQSLVRATRKWYAFETNVCAGAEGGVVAAGRVSVACVVRAAGAPPEDPQPVEAASIAMAKSMTRSTRIWDHPSSWLRTDPVRPEAFRPCDMSGVDARIRSERDALALGDAEHGCGRREVRVAVEVGADAVRRIARARLQVGYPAVQRHHHLRDRRDH